MPDNNETNLKSDEAKFANQTIGSDAIALDFVNADSCTASGVSIQCSTQADD